MARTARPTCAHGRPHGPGLPMCRGCVRFTERACQAFERDVFFGRFNWQGYSLAEWVKAGHPRETWRDARPRETP